MAAKFLSTRFVIYHAIAVTCLLTTTAIPNTASNEVWNSSLQNPNGNKISSFEEQFSEFNGSPDIDLPLDTNFSSNISEFTDNMSLENWWKVFDKKYLRRSMGRTVTLFVAYMLILVIGVVGNLMVILVFVFRPKMRSVTNMFIMNLAVADLFVILFCVPATLLSNIFEPWILGWFMCKGVAYVQGVSVCASAYSLATISFDSGLSKSQALATICLIWIVSLILLIPWAVKFNVIFSNYDSLTSCVETWEKEYHGKLYFLIANFIVCYCIPLLIICISNLAVFHHVYHRSVPQDSASAGPITNMHRKARHDVLKMLGAVTITFLISWLPLYIIVMRRKFGKDISENEYNLLEVLMPFAQWLGSSNSCVNPILYAFLNKTFRQMFKSILPAWILCERQQNIVLIATSNSISERTIQLESGNFVRTAANSATSGENNIRFSNRCSQNLRTGSQTLVASYSKETGRSSIRVTRSAEPILSVYDSKDITNPALETSL